MKENNIDKDADVKPEESQTTIKAATKGSKRDTAGGEEDKASKGSKKKNDALEALNKKLVEVEREKEEHLQGYLRLRADFENYKRRTRQEMLQAADNGKEELLLKLLPVLDNLERALLTSGEPDKWRAGVEMIFRQFLETLVETGLKPIPAVGETFDPKLHEALLREPSDQPENTILEEIKKGYLFGEKTLRPTLVKVAAAPELADEKEKE